MLHRKMNKLKSALVFIVAGITAFSVVFSYPASVIAENPKVTQTISIESGEKKESQGLVFGLVFLALGLGFVIIATTFSNIWKVIAGFGLFFLSNLNKICGWLFPMWCEPITQPSP